MNTQIVFTEPHHQDLHSKQVKELDTGLEKTPSRAWRIKSHQVTEARDDIWEQGLADREEFVHQDSQSLQQEASR